MSRDILGEYGSGSSQPQAARATCGGVLPGKTKDVMNYQPPTGPKGIMESQSPGLHGSNHGNENGPRMGGSHSGGPGIGGTNHGCCGSQGRY
jgi:hypothetical protein